jgi:tRNA G18 (ribose-2'-O)-methylase SpoU
MSEKLKIGEQLEGSQLYERQIAVRASSRLPAPTIVAVGLRVPENVGSVLRLADAAGSPNVLFVGRGVYTEADMARIHRTARNCEVFVQWEFCGISEFHRRAAYLRPMIALELTTVSQDIFETTLPEKCAIVIGGERHGIPEDVLNECDSAVYIPMYGVNGSMNVTHALAIALFEWRRQHLGNSD